jgi:hypothetical protein
VVWHGDAVLTGGRGAAEDPPRPAPSKKKKKKKASRVKAPGADADAAAAGDGAAAGEAAVGPTDEAVGAYAEGDVELATLAPPVEPVVAFERSLVVNGTETVVVDSDAALPTTSTPQTRFCLLGSEAHRRALLEKRSACEAKRADAERERLAKEAEEARLTEETERLDQQLHALDAHRVAHTDLLSQPVRSAAAGDSHATAHRFGALKHFVNIDYHPEERLIRKPIVRQFFKTETTEDGVRRDVLYREAEHRTANWNELFFDLVMVAALHSLGHALVTGFNGATLQRYILTFVPIWVVWTDVNVCLNIHDNGDLLIKTFVYLIMAMVVAMGSTAADALATTTNQFVGAFLLARFLVVRGPEGCLSVFLYCIVWVCLSAVEAVGARSRSGAGRPCVVAGLSACSCATMHTASPTFARPSCARPSLPC